MGERRDASHTLSLSSTGCEIVFFENPALRFRKAKDLFSFAKKWNHESALISKVLLVFKRSGGSLDSISAPTLRLV